MFVLIGGLAIEVFKGVLYLKKSNYPPIRRRVKKLRTQSERKWNKLLEYLINLFINSLFDDTIRKNIN